ncbi:membrane protein insertase YidC [Haliea sp. AH-315-K21]|uniref:Membrane insertase YidC/Oxa/ALB C-terminal domain-containing protein n=1 Tax=SAR86 cluster bacterium TaxID=2030880 RepID=A0A2A5CK59_9GAMM|nr:membrane protein insertase YidC [Haliea sp. AH-315-K21]MBN4075505.1 membrane protein insertase YidC [Gammaproteobacteria bacterium AH-315-E17]PCJ41823.1 MAG: hypothetical protein COA71_07375 [SAR86 cluster bacterium]PCJ43800.1 MAG: hypothetical protein COA71_02745 [SAR86 cluster bacterium]
MELWAIWTNFLASCIDFFALQFGLTEAVSIILLTLVIRILLFPLSYNTAYNSQKNKIAMEKLKPELDVIKEKYADQPSEVMQKTMSLYKENGIKIFSKFTALNLVFQIFFGLGTYQAIRNTTLNSKFLWISNIANPDLLLAILVGVLTYISMAMLPTNADQNMEILYLVPVLIAVFMLISFPSALGLYWGTSTLVTISQQAILRFVFLKQSREQSKI